MSAAARYIFHLITPVGAVNNFAKADSLSSENWQISSLAIFTQAIRTRELERGGPVPEPYSHGPCRMAQQ
jgi:hypothetical protein